MGGRLRFNSVVEQARGPGAAVAVIASDVARALGGLKLLAEPVAQAVKPETRAARIGKALAELRKLG